MQCVIWYEIGTVADYVELIFQQVYVVHHSHVVNNYMFLFQSLNTVVSLYKC